MRRCQGDTLRLSVTCERQLPHLQLRLVTNLEQADPQDWQRLPFAPQADGSFLLEQRLEQRGLWQFRLQASLDAGKTWWWDCALYTWLMVEPAAVREVKMYSLIPTASGTIKDWIELLPEIASMGFNMIHLLPLTRMDVSRSPYSAHDLFSFDADYLDPKDKRDGAAQFDDFVAAAQQHELGICVDLVLNHVGIGSQIIHQRPEWIVADPTEHDGFKRAGWQGHGKWHKWGDLALLNYSHVDESCRRELWHYMLQYARFWATYAARTGGMIRLDNLHSTHDAFSRYVLHELRSEFPDLLIFAELFASQETNERLILDCGLNLLLGTQWEHHFVPELRRYLSWIHETGDRVRYFLPISTHDSGTPAEEFGDVMSTVPRYAISCFYGHGLTGLAQGVEYGNRKKIEFIDRSEPIRLDQAVDFRPIIREFHGLLDQHPVFHSIGNLRFVDDGHNAILGAWRRDPTDSSHGFLLCTNLDIFNAQTLYVNLEKHKLPKGTWHDVHGGDSVKTSGNRMTITLPPCGVCILRADG